MDAQVSNSATAALFHKAGRDRVFVTLRGSVIAGSAYRVYS